MKRIITLILATVLLSGTAVAVVATRAQANHDCNTFVSTQADAERILIYNETLRFHASPRLYSTNRSRGVHCDAAVVMYSRGWKFESAACGDVWVRQVLSDGTTRILTPMSRRICGGQNLVLYCCLSTSAIVKVEGRRIESTQQGPLDAWVATVRT